MHLYFTHLHYHLTFNWFFQFNHCRYNYIIYLVRNCLVNAYENSIPKFKLIFTMEMCSVKKNVEKKNINYK